MKRALFLMLALPLAAAADGRALQDPNAVPTAADPVLINLGDLDSRLTVKVAVGQSGPYNFIIDTGAERTVVSRELAGTLRLAPGAPVNITSMTGQGSVDTVIVPELTIESIGQRHTITAPALYARNLGAAGLLGIDTLANQQVSIDFERDVMSVRPAARHRGPVSRGSDEIVVTAQSHFGQLIVTDAWYDGKRIQVVLDTGSQVSVGNNALYQLVASRLHAKDIQPIEVSGVTGGTVTANYAKVPRISIGSIQFDQVPIAFAEVAPFRQFGLTRRPALLLGMDALRSFRHVEIDFPNRQVRFLMKEEGLFSTGMQPGSRLRP